VGLGAYPEIHPQYARLVPGSPVRLTDAHSTYILVAAETGIPGLALFLAILVSVFARSMSVRRKVAAAAPNQERQLWYLELGLIGYLLAGLFGSFPMLAFLYVQMALIFSAAEVVDRQWKREYSQIRSGPGRRSGMARRAGIGPTTKSSPFSAPAVGENG